jgi:hypothetical protein
MEFLELVKLRSAGVRAVDASASTVCLADV